MRSMQLLHWTESPALALSAEGRVLALNRPCSTAVGPTAPSLAGRTCSEVAGEVDGRFDAASSTRCRLLQAVAAGAVADFRSCALGVIAGAASPASLTGITIPPGERDDDVAAIILLEPTSETNSAAAPREDAARAGTTGGTLNLKLLGPIEVQRDGVSQSVPRRRARELLALLALAGRRGMGREEICETLWPASPRGAGRGHLRVVLHAIRHDLGDDLIEDLGRTCGNDSRLRLHSDVCTDVDEVERVATVRQDVTAPVEQRKRLEELARVLRQYRNVLDEAGEFGTWVVPHQERLRGHLVALLTEAIPLAASLAEIEAAVDYCRRAIQLDPFEEGFRLSLIALYGHLGRHRDAQLEYDRYARLLAEELAAVPSAHLRRAVRRPA